MLQGQRYSNKSHSLGRLLQHVVTVPARDGDKGNRFGVVTDLLDEVGSLLDDFVESVLGPLASVHLVASNNELPDTEGEGEESVLSGLTVLGNTSLELSNTGGNDENGTVGLGGTGDHVLDKVSVTRSVNDRDLVSGGLEFPKSNVDGDTTLTLGLEFVKNPGVFERGYGYQHVKNIMYSHLPSSAASFSNFSMVRLSIPPHL